MADFEEQPDRRDLYAENLLRDQAAAVESGDTAAADATALKLLIHFSERAASEEPSEELLLYGEADDALEVFDWAGAEAAYEKSLTLARSKNDFANQYHSLDKLRGLYQFLGQNDRALMAAQDALAAAESYAVMPLKLAALEGLASATLRMKDVAAALRAANELLDKAPNSRMYGVRRARGLVWRASCYLELDSLDLAQADLKLALPLLTSASTAPLMVGNHSAMANWHAISAKALTKLGEGDCAVEECRQAVECRRVVTRAPQLIGPFKYAALANALQQLAEALVAIERTEEAEIVSLEARAIREQIHQP